MIGVSVILSIAVLIGAFTFIYAMLDPFVGDFVHSGPASRPTTTQDVAELATTNPAQSGASVPTASVPTAAVPAAIPAPTAPPTTAATPPPADAFKPDYRVSSTSRINFREGPGVRFPVVTTVAPGTEVQSLNESQPTQDPAADLLSPGRQWLRFKLQDGQEGWIRDVDVTLLGP